jgi:hypothetical protein
VEENNSFDPFDGGHSQSRRESEEGREGTGGFLGMFPGTFGGSGDTSIPQEESVLDRV